MNINRRQALAAISGAAALGLCGGLVASQSQQITSEFIASKCEELCGTFYLDSVWGDQKKFLYRIKSMSNIDGLKIWFRAYSPRTPSMTKCRNWHNFILIIKNIPENIFVYDAQFRKELLKKCRFQTIAMNSEFLIDYQDLVDNISLETLQCSFLFGDYEFQSDFPQGCNFRIPLDGGTESVTFNANSHVWRGGNHILNGKKI